MLMSEITIELRRSLIESAKRDQRDMQEHVGMLQEIRQSNWMIWGTTWGVMLTMAWITTLGGDYDFMVVLLGIAWIHAMARYHYLIHRIGAFLRSSGSAWQSSDQRNKRKWILALSDIGCMLPIVYLFGVGVYGLWVNGSALLASFYGIWFACGLFLLVSAANPGQKIHIKRSAPEVPAWETGSEDGEKA